MPREQETSGHTCHSVKSFPRSPFAGGTSTTALVSGALAGRRYDPRVAALPRQICFSDSPLFHTNGPLKFYFLLSGHDPMVVYSLS